MRSFSRWVDRFCRKHPNFAIPNLMSCIVFGTAIVWLLDQVFSFLHLVSASALLSFAPSAILQGQIWRLVTFVFVPSSHDLLYLALSLFMYYYLGTQLEHTLGSTRFTLFYLMGVGLTILCGFILWFSPFQSYITADANYINLSLFLAFASLYPDMVFRIYFLIPIRGKWLALVYVVLIGIDVVGNLIAGYYLLAAIPLVSLLNWFLFFGENLFNRTTAPPVRTHHKPTPQPVDLRAAQKQAQAEKGYLHKCVICGITDANDQTMEFRYCSKCRGYYCYCANHINNHTHVE